MKFSINHESVDGKNAAGTAVVLSEIEVIKTVIDCMERNEIVTITPAPFNNEKDEIHCEGYHSQCQFCCIGSSICKYVGWCQYQLPLREQPQEIEEHSDNT